MATRIKRQTNTLHDTTTGTVNIVHGSASKPQNIGFFDRSFTNTGSSRRRKRRRRLHARARQAALAKAAAEAQATAQAESQAQHEAQLRAQAAEHARTEAENRTRAEREQAYRHTINTLAQAQHSLQADLAKRYTQAASAQAAMLHGEVVSNIEPLTGNPTGQQLADLILQEKARINDLLAQKSNELEKRSLETLAQAEALAATTTQRYRDYLESRSHGDAALAQQAHQAWSQATDNVQESKLLADAIVLLEQQSVALSERHALLTQPDTPATPPSKDPAPTDFSADRLWSAVGASGSPSTLPAPSDTLEKARQVARNIFLKTAADVLKRYPAVALALYSPSLADAQRPSSTIATPVSQLNLPHPVDLGYVASVNGSIDVPHRLAMVDDGQQPVARWVATDGVAVGTKVRVRHFTYNAQNKTYEFIRDGDTTPALVWTPIEQPADSSTSFPGQKPLLPADPGTDVSPQEGWLEDLPGFANDDPDDYILVFPPGSGLPDTYVLFKSPRDLPGTATGYGKPVTGTWLGESASKHGSPIPAHIANQIRGQEFKSFGKFREAVWAAISRDVEIRTQFARRNTVQLDRGRSPFTIEADQVGGRMRFEMHHVIEIAKGGAVYDIDNIVIVTPKRHIQIHRGDKNEKQN
ncbi:S-type pyocin domain-containing protein [Pseudomonas sp. 21LCFQ010]|uniref:S-type pyocin domain-containing protein n=1 Tax=Pseudomonas sp. 21LCFQ010 TaxID=2957506 RepID=UPI002097B216|nr:S-type pyocin domain-containing protein [Pseudomonas sp. 21LCFQ010]MCO8165301.1 S-type pyocin domain-containing protein [Pseudomonas sp. 21LCFQ010]